MMSRVALAKQLGLTEERVRQLDDYRDGDFSEREKLALEFTELFATAPQAVTDEFFQRLRTSFTEKEIVELGFALIVLNGAHRFNTAIDLEPANPRGLTYTDLPGALPAHTR